MEHFIKLIESPSCQGHNAFRKTPCLPLRKLANATTLVLDGNLFATLPSGALHDVRVKFLSISRNAHLARIDENAIRSMPHLQVLKCSRKTD